MQPANILAIALPTLTVLVGILLNQASTNRLDARISALEVALRAEISGQTGSLRAEMAGLRGELNALRVSFHNDVVMLIERDNKLDARVSRLEQTV